MKTVTCRLCQFKAADLVPHIESAHAEALTLDSYMTLYGGLDSVMTPEEQARLAALEANPEPPTMAASVAKTPTPTTAAKVKIAGIDMTKRTVSGEALRAVPSVDPAYEFQEEITKRVLLTINKARPVLLIGHTGTGKTSLVQQIAARIGQPTVRVNLNQQTTYADFIGQWTVVAGEMVWVDGVLPHAMKNGYWLIIDEIDYGEANILCSLNSVLEKHPSLTLKEKNKEAVTVHENFRVFGTGNACGAMKEWRHLYQGTNLMNEAWVDRWTVFKIEYLNDEAEARVLSNSVDKLSLTVAKELVKIANMVRKAFVEETVGCTFSTRRLLDWSEATISEVLLSGDDRSKKAEAPIRAAEYTVFNKIAREDTVAVEGMMRRVLMGRETASR
jgi:cobaltochelatase CobS